MRERHPFFSWPAHIKMYHEYGGQAVLVNTSVDEGRKVLSKDEREKLADIALIFGGIQARGFVLETESSM